MKKLSFICAIFSLLLISCGNKNPESASLSIRLPEVNSRSANYSKDQIESFKIEVLPEGFEAEALTETAAPGDEVEFQIETAGTYTVKVIGINSVFGEIASGSDSVTISLGKDASITVIVKMGTRPTGEAEISVIAYNIAFLDSKSDDGTQITFTIVKEGESTEISSTDFTSVEWYINGTKIKDSSNAVYTVNLLTDLNLNTSDSNNRNTINAVVHFGDDVLKSCTATFEAKIEVIPEPSNPNGII